MTNPNPTQESPGAPADKSASHSRMGVLSMIRMAFDALARKKGRNILTMSGVLIGVFALTTIVSLGEGMTMLLSDKVSGDDNLRQVSVTAGTGYQVDDDDAESEIPETLPDDQRNRLIRAERSRKRPGGNRFAARVGLDEAALKKLRDVEHVVATRPLIGERYVVEFEDQPALPRLTLGVDTAARRYEDRVIAGKYITSPLAQEVVIHEFLAYQWGLTSQEQLDSLIGKKITLRPMNAEEASDDMMARLRILSGVADKLEPSDFDSLRKKLSLEEQMALIGALNSLGSQPEDGDAPERKPLPRPDDLTLPAEFTIVGVGREMMPGDQFNVLEDGNAYQVDLFFSQEMADKLYRTSTANRERGYMNIMTTVDAPKNAEKVEQEARRLGHTAISVSGVLQSLEGTLAALTIMISFLTGIALLVAALGIVNTMLTSVLERTREIGLWKALGATNGQIMTIFLMEASLIGLIGGTLGLLLSFIAMIPGNGYALQMISESSSMPVEMDVFQLPLWLVFAGPLLATLVAMLAAIVPAWRASRIDPVRALRHD